jgi:hypothetical protein
MMLGRGVKKDRGVVGCCEMHEQQRILLDAVISVRKSGQIIRRVRNPNPTTFFLFFLILRLVLTSRRLAFQVYSASATERW